jgi:hypothetical protein
LSWWGLSRCTRSRRTGRPPGACVPPTPRRAARGSSDPAPPRYPICNRPVDRLRSDVAAVTAGEAAFAPHRDAATWGRVGGGGR